MLCYDDCWRWCIYELNLLGDPQLPLWHGPPSELALTQNDTVRTGTDTIRVEVRSGGAPVANALVCAWKPGEVFATGQTDGAGRAMLEVNPALPGEMSLTVSRAGYRTRRHMITVIPGSPAAFLVYGTYMVDDEGQANPNRVLEPGETDRLLVTVRNIGTLGATQVRGRLRSQTSMLVVTDSLGDYGSIGAGASSQGEAFEVWIRPNATPNSLGDLELEVTADQGSWTLGFAVYVGHPALAVADLDSGAGLLSVSAMASLGYDRQPRTMGRGFRYPQSDTSCLYYGSFMLGTGPGYVADNYYGQPTTSIGSDWRLSESLRYVLPNWGGSQQIEGSYVDDGFSTPRGVRVRQRSFMVNRPGYDDFAVLVYDISNLGSSHMDRTYAGLICDFDVVPTDRLHDHARADRTRRAAWMWNALSANPTVGVRLLSAGSLSNATVIDPQVYLYPDSALSEDMKFRILNGGMNRLVSDRFANWSVAVAVGPFELCPGTSRRVAFALVGGPDTVLFHANCDSAQSWYDRFVAIDEGTPTVVRTGGSWLSAGPNPCSGKLRVSYQVRVPGPVRLALFDRAGRRQREILCRPVAGSRGSLVLGLGGLAPGVYFLELVAGNERVTTKILLTRA
ncbi:MAG: hypothetical protein ABIK62_01445 [candidate division WOR-3 bacterium]